MSDLIGITDYVSLFGLDAEGYCRLNASLKWDTGPLFPTSGNLAR